MTSSMGDDQQFVEYFVQRAWIRARINAMSRGARKAAITADSAGTFLTFTWRVVREIYRQKHVEDDGYWFSIEDYRVISQQGEEADPTSEADTTSAQVSRVHVVRLHRHVFNQDTRSVRSPTRRPDGARFGKIQSDLRCLRLACAPKPEGLRLRPPQLFRVKLRMP